MIEAVEAGLKILGGLTGISLVFITDDGRGLETLGELLLQTLIIEHHVQAPGLANRDLPPASGVEGSKNPAQFVPQLNGGGLGVTEVI